MILDNYNRMTSAGLVTEMLMGKVDTIEDIEMKRSTISHLSTMHLIRQKVSFSVIVLAKLFVCGIYASYEMRIRSQSFMSNRLLCVVKGHLLCLKYSNQTVHQPMNEMGSLLCCSTTKIIAYTCCVLATDLRY